MGKCNIRNSYVIIQNNEAYLLGSLIDPISNNLYIQNNYSSRTRKLLLKKHEIKFIYEKIYYNKYTTVGLMMYWKNNWCKIKIAIAKGKKNYDKRYDIKQREWNLNKSRINKNKIIKSITQ
uniref:SsrA-binding protein n=1 Tax=Candidatus Aschnera chinzeii TaxID=1485666 RepID=A0AAT9G4C4_9ENTR|nr:MAG: hypothetical protein ACHINZ_2560 [Candidatus Aschnera chinzeii]